MARAGTVSEVWERFPSAEELRPRYPAEDAAQMAHVKLSTLRLCEVAGVIVPPHNPERLYSSDDVKWIECIHYLLNTWGLTLEKLRRLLGTVDCTELTHCSPDRYATCPFPGMEGAPCWVVAAPDNRKCYSCPVYRLARYRICGPNDLNHAQAWAQEHSI